jgi:ribosomal protein S18 acetylase RimI-like enzyme
MSSMEIQRQHPGSAPPPGLRIRRATTEDAERVAVTHVASWRVGYDGLLPDALLANLSVETRTRSWIGRLDRSGGSRTLIAISDDDTVHGFTTVGPSRDDDAAPGTGELWALYTHPDAWGRGVGAALIGSAKSELRALGFSRATLWVLTDNERARGFYERHGWQLEGQSRVDWRGDVRLDEVRYELAGLNGLT